MNLQILATRPAERCAVCHDALGEGAPAVCVTCRVEAHVSCLLDLGRCPTLGCAPGATPRTAPRRIEIEVARAAGWSPWSLVRSVIMSACQLALVLFGLWYLAGIVFVARMPNAHKARVARVRADMKSLSGALDLFRIDTGRDARTLDELWARPADTAPRSAGTSPRVPRWGPEPYIEDCPPKDPWGTEYLYVPARGGHELVSLGADCTPGGEDEARDLSSSTIDDPE